MTVLSLLSRCTVPSVVAAIMLMGTAFSSAVAYPADVVRKCRGDYKRLCPQYKKAGADLDACMRSSYRSISGSCMNSLVDAGMAPPFARRR
jgi:hypothetical protein